MIYGTIPAIIWTGTKCSNNLVAQFIFHKMFFSGKNDKGINLIIPYAEEVVKQISVDDYKDGEGFSRMFSSTLFRSNLKFGLVEIFMRFNVFNQ